MKIGCATLAYNQGEFIEEAVASVLNQQFLGKYIVYDPGSNDCTSDSIAKFQNDLDYLRVEKDLGPADGLNYCLSRISSDIFYYLNADDRVVEGAFKYVAEYFERNPKCDILHGSVNIINRRGEYVKTLPSMKFSLLRYAMQISVVYQQATFIRRKALKNDAFNIENHICWDGELIVDLVRNGAEIHQTNEILGEFRIYVDSLTGSYNYANKLKSEHERIAVKILGYRPNKLQFAFYYFLGKYFAVGRAIKTRIRFQRKYFKDLKGIRNEQN